jgi:hypothetical protein
VGKVIFADGYAFCPRADLDQCLQQRHEQCFERFRRTQDRGNAYLDCMAENVGGTGEQTESNINAGFRAMTGPMSEQVLRAAETHPACVRAANTGTYGDNVSRIYCLTDQARELGNEINQLKDGRKTLAQLSEHARAIVNAACPDPANARCLEQTRDRLRTARHEFGEAFNRYLGMAHAMQSCDVDTSVGRNPCADMLDTVGWHDPIAMGNRYVQNASTEGTGRGSRGSGTAAQGQRGRGRTAGQGRGATEGRGRGESGAGTGDGAAQRPRSEGGGTCPAGTDCSRTIQVPLQEAWVSGERLYECPAHLSRYNCLNLGSGQSGDLLAAGRNPQIRERICTEKLRALVTPDGVMRNAAAAVTLTGEARLASPTLLSRVGRFLSGTRREGEPAMTACDLYYKEVLRYRDPSTGEPAVPALDTPEKVELALVDDGALRDLLVSTADVVTRLYQDDLGTFSVKKQARNIFNSEALLSDDASVILDDTAFERSLAQLVGDGTPTACLPADDRESLRNQLRADRLRLREGIQEARAAGRLGEASELKSNWVRGLQQAARREHDLEKGVHVISTLRARLGCGRGSATTANLPANLHDDFVTDPAFGARRISTRRGSTFENASPTYQARMAWFVAAPPAQRSRYEQLTGHPAPSLTADGGTSCDELLHMARELNRQLGDTRSQHPLLMDDDPEINSTWRMTRTTSGRNLTNQARKVECAHDASDPYNTYGAADLAGGFESAQFDSAENPLADCHRPRRLADNLLTNADWNAPTAVTAAGNRMKKRAVDRLKGICGPGKDKRKEEGKRVACMDGMVSDYLGCGDVGDGSSACRNRESFGWAACRACGQEYTDEQFKKEKEFLTQFGLFIANTAAMMVPGGGLAMRLVNIALIGGGSAMEYRHKQAAERRASDAYVDLHRRDITWDQYRSALAESDAVSDGFWGWQALNAVFLGVEVNAARGIMREYRAARSSRSMRALAESDDVRRGFDAARGRGNLASSTDDVLAHLNRLDPSGALAAEYLDEVVKPGLSRRYGENIYLLTDAEDVTALAKLEERLSAIEAADPTLARAIREEAAGHLGRMACPRG